ncbi:hypothetical protein HGM15179_020052 [Zosterops borbonicus]|uniref:N-alpha-acetyltransferase 40 n=1 Tax=Zosterops borbonicus TaxID=364589 RepID=A0A8K1D873_9PASS|nr:hypothetical protein HGM15179_020052 [Zosterops borbonicus]
MGRKSSRAKEKKQRRLEERAAMAAVCAKVEAANKLRDPLEAFPVFKKYDRNGLNVSIECCRVSSLDPPTLDWAFELTKANMQSLWVFFPRFEGFFPRFGVILGCLCRSYEVQLESRVRRRGLGKFLLQILQLVANSTQMKKVMLTVFKHNHGALQFFREALQTPEFLFACKSLQGRQDGAGLQVGRAAPGPGRPRSEFSLMAKRIGKDLSNTFAKLEKLTILAKRKSLFDDKSVEIEELTYIIKQDMNSLNKQIAQLGELLRARGGPAGRHGHTHSNTVVVSLQSRLASMSNDFKSVLEVRTENLRQQRSRREQFSRPPVSALAANNLGEPGGFGGL